jgi:hypothetical protein
MYINLLQVKSDTVQATSSFFSIGFNSPLFFWISLIEFLIIVFLIFKATSRKKNLAFSDVSKDSLKEVKTTSIDMDNLMNSINGSRDLYKILSRNCHPDKFVNTDKHSIAEELFQEITKHKRDFKILTELKQRAETELNIKF